VKKLSRQPDSYLYFEVARLRTLWKNNEDIRDRVENRYKLIKEELSNRGLRFGFKEHKIDKILHEREEQQNKLITCKVVAVEKAKHKVGPLIGKEIDNVYEYIVSENDKVVGRTTGTQIEANIKDELVLKRLENRVYSVISKSVNQKEDNLVSEVTKEQKET